ncbi:hypothetical protein PV04_06769 [Phialophora macrospora]|uniref:Transcription factor domain-containing protein n=1 Tax=Phialophora macrospora TaxID=1851006 RepID=A0A0D2FLE1_9EURO|nr:hypothetical protein PV04_06769 [Phialophora macrospora]
MVYFQHFDGHVKATLPASLHGFAMQSLDCPFLQYAVLCLAASNLSTLDASLTRRNLVADPRRSTASPNPNRLHSCHARRYCELAAREEQSQSPQNASLTLIGKVLLAYYHHASTDHLRFRLAVLETASLVRRHRDEIKRSHTGDIALQLWYRLHISHRPSEPVDLVAGNDDFVPKGAALPSAWADEGIYLHCIVGLSSDDLLYDIILKTMELRRRIVVQQCTAAMEKGCGSPPTRTSMTQRLMNGSTQSPDSRPGINEVNPSFVAPCHLLALLDIQERRLEVWKSRVVTEEAASIPSPQLGVQKLTHHRRQMNHLYSLLCRLIFGSATSLQGAVFDQDRNRAMLCEVVDTIDRLDLTMSNLVDVYGYSLSEVLLQLSYNMPSTTYFNHVLDVVWPQMEVHGRGYENSHLPTHLAKRIIAMMAEEWQRSRRILLVTLAIPENTPKAVLYDIHHYFDVLLYGYDHKQGEFFINKLPLS